MATHLQTYLHMRSLKGPSPLKSGQAEQGRAYGDKFGHMGPNGTKLEQNGAKRGQTGLNGAIGAKKGQIGPNWIKRG